MFGLLLRVVFQSSPTLSNIPRSDRKAEAKRRAREEQTRRTRVQASLSPLAALWPARVCPCLSRSWTGPKRRINWRASSSSGPVRQSSLLQPPGSPSSSAGPGGDKVAEASLKDADGSDGDDLRRGRSRCVRVQAVWTEQCGSISVSK